MEEIITLDYGSGGKKTSRLIEKHIVPRFDNEALKSLGDGAVIPGGEMLAFSTDSFVVDPLFFPGGNIGKLAVCGTVNDVAMCGAEPKFLSCALILEEGLPLETLERVLQSMRHAAEEAGYTPYIAAAYRTYSYQTQMFNAMASSLSGNMDYLDPEYQKYAEQAKKIVMYPGSSEHQLGLAVDIWDRQRNQNPGYENMNQEFFAWLDEHCAQYGFIKRYPTRKLLLTGWDEPWHYRYVGVEAARYIMQHGICYEEFYKHYMPDFKY